jgi:serine/threonine protein kinase
MNHLIGKYQIIEIIGEGGFGRVLKASDPEMNRIVALKIMTGEPDATLLRRFKNEAIVAGSLNHPNLITVFEFGSHQGRPFMAMEYLKGRDLSQVLANDIRLSLAQKLDILLQTARGLHKAHTNQIIHRDVKPANVMLLDDGTVKIMDFGIARLNHESALRNTGTGMVVGSIMWMAPELFTGGEADVQSDVWSFGVMAFELLSGRHPYGLANAASPAQLVFQITQTSSPDLGVEAPSLPQPLVEIVRRLMAKDREERYHSLEDAAFDLEPLLVAEKKVHSAQLIRTAEREADDGRLDHAMKLIREALEADRESKAGRLLRERVSRELHKHTSKSRIDVLIRESAEEFQAQRYIEAAQKLQAALQLDRDNPTLRSRLSAVQSLIERRKKAEGLTQKAGFEYRAGDLESSNKLIEEALALEPKSTELNELRRLVQLELARREFRDRMNSDLSMVRELISKRDSAGALRILDQVDALLPRDAVFDSVRFESQNLRAQSTEMESIRQTMLRCEVLESECAWSEIVEVLGPMAPMTGSMWPEIYRLEQRAQHELARLRTQIESSRVGKEIDELVRKEQWVDAIAKIAGALEVFPNNAGFLTLQRKLLLEQAERERKNNIESARQRISELNDMDRYEDALVELDRNTVRLPDTGWPELHRQTVMAFVRWLLTRSRYQEATRAVDAGLSRHRSDPDLTLLRSEIQQAEASARKREEAAVLRLKIEGLFESDADEALRLSHVAIQRFPKDVALLNCMAHAESLIMERDAIRNMRSLRDAVTRAEACIARMEWSGAHTLAEEIRRNFPNEPAADALVHRIIQEQKRKDAEKQCGEIVELIQAQDWASAQKALGKFQRSHPNAAAGADLKASIEQGLKLDRINVKSEEITAMIRSGNLANAERILSTFILEFPGEQAGAQLRQQLHQEQRRVAIASRADAIRTLIHKRRVEHAKQELIQFQAQFQGEPECAEIATLLEGAIVAEVAARVRGLIAQDRIEQARADLARAFASLSAIPPLEALTAEIAHAESQRFLRIEHETSVLVRGLMLSGDVDRARHEATIAFTKLPDSETLRLLMNEIAQAEAAKHQYQHEHSEQDLDLHIPSQSLVGALAKRSRRGWVLKMGIGAIAAAGIVSVWRLQDRFAPPEIVDRALPSGARGVSYFGQLAAQGGKPPYRWSIQKGTLPSGVSLAEGSGVLSGTPSSAGDFVIQVGATGGDGSSSKRHFRLVIRDLPTATDKVGPSDHTKASSDAKRVALKKTSVDLSKPQKEREPAEPGLKSMERSRKVEEPAPFTSRRESSLLNNKEVTSPSAPIEVEGQLSMRGTLIWTAGLLEPGATLAFMNGQPVVGRLDGRRPNWPTVQLAVQRPAGVVVEQYAGNGNFQLRNNSNQQVSSIQLQWSRR